MATSLINNDDKINEENNLETFSLIWLDENVNRTEENLKAQKKLRAIINQLKTFENENLCERYIQTTCLGDRIVLIVSGQFGESIVPRIHSIRQLSSIYVYCFDKKKHQQWTNKFSKIKSVTADLKELRSQIKSDQSQRTKIEDPILINIFIPDKNLEKSTTGINGQFIYSQLLIDVLLRMKTNQNDKKQFTELCKKFYDGNKNELDIINEFEMNYSSKEAVWWYTRETFIYKILNKALRIQNIDILFVFSFFIRDIYQQLKEYQCQTPVRAYRGQLLSIDEIKTLQKSIGQFISINSFFSATKKRQDAFHFFRSDSKSNDLERVLFEIDGNPLSIKTKPFADVSSLSIFSCESEILFMIGSIFRLEKIDQGQDQIWIIQITLCNDDEHELNNLFQFLKNKYKGGNNETTLLDLGKLLRRMGKFDLAEKFYRRLVSELPNDDPSLSELYYSLGLVLQDKNDLDSSLHYLKQSLDFELQTFPPDCTCIGNRYNVIGNIYRKKKKYNTALKWYNKGMELYKQENAVDHRSMAQFYNNMALVYKEQEKYAEALEYHEKALIIQKKDLPPDHPDIAASYNNIGISHQFLGDYDQAMMYYNQSLNIRLKALPDNHPLIASSYRNLGSMYEDKDDYNESLKYYQKAATIYRQSSSSQHENLIIIEEDIDRVLSSLQ